MRRSFTLLIALTAFACENESPPKAGPAPSPEPPSVAPLAPAPSVRATTKTYGAALTGSAETVALATLLKEPDKFEGKTVGVEGEVRRACSKKGCWMELAEAMGADAGGARVTFKDYGFFVPTDSAGAHAKLEAVVNVRTLKPGQVEHLEQEGAKIAKLPDGSAKEVQLVANGVELTK